MDAAITPPSGGYGRGAEGSTPPQHSGKVAVGQMESVPTANIQ